jgi:hypothetical protein
VSDTGVGFAARSRSSACDLGDRPGISTMKSRSVVRSGHDSRRRLLRSLIRVPASLTGLGSVLISVLGIGWPGSRSSGCAESPQEAHVIESGGWASSLSIWGAALAFSDSTKTIT